MTAESKDLTWVELKRVTALNPEESMARMVRKILVRPKYAPAICLRNALIWQSDLSKSG